MDSINDLRQGVTVGEERVDMFSGKRPRQQQYSTPSEDRIEFDLTQMPAPEPTEIPGVTVRESLAKDILEGEDSPFGKYKAEKTAEMAERMAEYEEELTLKEDDEEIDFEEDFDDNEETGTGFLEQMNYREEDVVVEDKNDIIYAEPEVENTEDFFPGGPVAPTTDTEDYGGPDGPDEEWYEQQENKVDKVAEAPKVEEKVMEDTELNMSSTEVELDIADEEEVQVMDAEDMLKHLKKLATEKIKPVSQKLDISSFTVLKKAKANTSMVEQQVKVAKWVLPNQNAIVLMKEYLGSELEALREFSEDPESLVMLSIKFRSIYDHIVSPKAESFEAWCKATPFSDMDHYFFAVYISAFKGVNYLPADCANTTCRETFLTDNIEIMDMVEFIDDKAKEKFLKLYKSEDMFNGKGVYCTEIVPLSDKIAVAFREPSVFNVFENASLDDAFKAKYSSIIGFIPYIDTIYMIDQNAKTLTPVSYKSYPDNAIKTTKSKVHKFDKLLKTLSVDEFGIVKAYVQGIMENTVGMVYKFPEVTCVKCGKPIEKKYATAEELVFTRYQLGALVNTSLS